jgi:hypothetical protein
MELNAQHTRHRVPLTSQPLFQQQGYCTFQGHSSCLTEPTVLCSQKTIIEPDPVESSALLHIQMLNAFIVPICASFATDLIIIKHILILLGEEYKV